MNNKLITINDIILNTLVIFDKLTFFSVNSDINIIVRTDALEMIL